MSKPPIRGSIYLFIAAFVWGMAFAAQSSAMEHVQPFTFNMGRSLITFAVLGTLIAIRPNFGEPTGSTGAPAKRYFAVGALLGGILFAASSLQQIGLVHTTAGKSGFITALYIVIVPLIGIFAGRKVGAPMWVSVAVTFAGLCLLCLKENLSVGLGELLTLGCALVFSLHILCIDRYAGGLNAIKVCCLQFGFNALFCGAAMLIFESPSLSAIAACWPSLLYVGVAAGAIGYTLQLLGQRSTDPTIASLIMCLESVFAALGGWMLLGETLRIQELIGCALMLAGCVAAQISAKQIDSAPR